MLEDSMISECFACFSIKGVLVRNPFSVLLEVASGEGAGRELRRATGRATGASAREEYARHAEFCITGAADKIKIHPTKLPKG